MFLGLVGKFIADMIDNEVDNQVTQGRYKGQKIALSCVFYILSVAVLIVAGFILFNKFNLHLLPFIVIMLILSIVMFVLATLLINFLYHKI